jgi:hypothetical protein
MKYWALTFLITNNTIDELEIRQKVTALAKKENIKMPLLKIFTINDEYFILDRKDRLPSGFNCLEEYIPKNVYWKSLFRKSKDEKEYINFRNNLYKEKYEKSAPDRKRKKVRRRLSKVTQGKLNEYKEKYKAIASENLNAFLNSDEYKNKVKGMIHIVYNEDDNFIKKVSEEFSDLGEIIKLSLKYN